MLDGAARGFRLSPNSIALQATRGLRGISASRHWDPLIPVNASDGGLASNGRATGPQQMYGNGWEWTASVFAAFPGFEPFPFYTNYSEPFFDGDHYVLKGASPRTADCFLRPSFRNWFRPEYPYLYSTFRLVES